MDSRKYSCWAVSCQGLFGICRRDHLLAGSCKFRHSVTALQKYKWQPWRNDSVSCKQYSRQLLLGYAPSKITLSTDKIIISFYGSREIDLEWILKIELLNQIQNLALKKPKEKLHLQNHLSIFAQDLHFIHFWEHLMWTKELMIILIKECVTERERQECSLNLC